jgi:hypothetical protein
MQAVDTPRTSIIVNTMAKKPKTKKMTLETLAVAIQQDFSAIRDDMTSGFRAVREEMMGKMQGDMATKEDLRKIREEMATKEDVADVRDQIAVAKEELREQIAGLRYAKEIDALRERVKLVEQKLGIKHTHRAA